MGALVKVPHAGARARCRWQPHGWGVAWCWLRQSAAARAPAAPRGRMCALGAYRGAAAAAQLRFDAGSDHVWRPLRRHAVWELWMVQHRDAVGGYLGA